jgi:cytochrome c biogenesis factor
MIIHPPFLYLGYVGLTIPFSIALAGLIGGEFGAPATLAVQKQFFDTHLAPWAPRFFADLEKAEAARFYRPVGRVGRLLCSIEAEALALET